MDTSNRKICFSHWQVAVLVVAPLMLTRTNAAQCPVKDFYAGIVNARPVVTTVGPATGLGVESVVVTGRTHAVARAAGGGAIRPPTPKEEFKQKVLGALAERDQQTFMLLMPTDDARRKQALRATDALYWAYFGGSLAIVQQIQIWDPTALHSLISRGNGQVLKGVSEKWASVSHLQREGQPVVHPPNARDFVVLIRQLLSAGAKPDGDKTYQSPLAVIAAIPPSPEVLEAATMLIEGGASIEPRGPFYPSPLAAAASQQNRALVELMLRARRPTQDALDGALLRTPFVEANPIISALLERGANINADGRKHGLERGSFPADVAAYRAKYHGERDLMRLFIRYKVDPNLKRSGFTSPLMTVMHDHELMAGLLELGAHANYQNDDGNTPLLWATRLPKEFKKSSDDNRPLHVIEPAFDPEARRKSVALLLQYGAAPKIANKGGVTPLMQTTHDDGGSVALLLAKGGTINLAQYAAFYNQAAYGTKTGAVSAALLHHNDALAAALLLREPGIPAEDCGAVYYAAQNGGTRTLAELLNRKADVYAAKADEGKTPLHVAAAFGQVASVSLLLDRRAAKIDESTPAAMKSCGGHGFAAPCLTGRKTALMYAVLGGHAAVVEELIRRGADVNRKDYTGTTALGYARQSNQEVIALLKAHGAR